MCFGSKAKLKKNPPPAPVPVSRPQGFNQWLESNPYYERPGAPRNHGDIEAVMGLRTMALVGLIVEEVQGEMEGVGGGDGGGCS
ncbi:hypothetical protein HYFRA_00010440 [Hymenoscyphus fraxineus]|uniref:Uncharacterized protein n=1 Tax=Hymenoscyphus fraxineus TaxID=746836 RepID=A0A9N9PKV8_9HELO|nr:hypothetical protein HYFRA_00010440 [Hymenoscyphus fraxineus]